MAVPAAPPNTTLNSAKAWAPDVQGFSPLDAIPTALILQTATHAGVVEGDAVAVRVPFVSSVDEVGFVQEGAEIPLGAGRLDEVAITTGKVATLGLFSREQLAQPQASDLVVRAMAGAIVSKADAAYLANASAPAGLLSTAGITDAGALGTNLDTLTTAVLGIEAAGGRATHVIASPSAWGAIAQLKTGTASAQTLLGAGTEAAERRVLGVPVLTSPQMPADTLLVVDQGAVLGVFGDLRIDRSDEAAFSRDAVMVRSASDSAGASCGPSAWRSCRQRPPPASPAVRACLGTVAPE